MIQAFDKIKTLVVSIGLLCGASCGPPSNTNPNLGNPSDSRQYSFDSELQAAALSLITAECSECHAGANKSGGVENIDLVDQLVSSGLVVPGDSRVGRLMGAIEDGSMPPGSPLNEGQKGAIRDWIDSGQFSDSVDGAIEPTFSAIYQNIIQASCINCHNSQNPSDGVNYETYESTLATGHVVPEAPNLSNMYLSVLDRTGELFGGMPQQPYEPLPRGQIEAIRQWIDAGALNN